mmetsp:Transcript_19962/g.57996  ORF Transcript_19962/g.57996 Transcript_19962/m.57996 type:complete len:349 (+) Transcript_19962:40-1086(+)
MPQQEKAAGSSALRPAAVAHVVVARAAPPQVLRPPRRSVAHVADVVERQSATVPLPGAEALQPVTLGADVAPPGVPICLAVPPDLRLLGDALACSPPLAEVPGDQTPRHRALGDDCLLLLAVRVVVVWPSRPAASTAVLPVGPRLQRAARRHALLRRASWLEAPPKLEAAIPAEGHPLVDALQPCVPRRRPLPVTLRNSTAGLRRMADVELHGLPGEGLRHLVAVDDVHRRRDSSAAALYIPAQGDGEVAVGADLHGAMLLSKILEVSLFPRVQVGCDLPDELERVPECLGRPKHIIASKPEKVEDLRVIDVRGGILSAARRIAMPATSCKRLLRPRIEQHHRHTLRL